MSSDERAAAADAARPAAEEKPEDAAETEEAEEVFSLLKRGGTAVPSTAASAAAAESAAAKPETHRFWDTQPVPKPGVTATYGPIDAPKSVSDVRPEPYGLPSGYEWSTLDITRPDVREEVYTLLSNNYVEDDEALFRFNYSPEFLLWALTPPGYEPSWLVGVRASKSGRLFACITGVPAHITTRAGESTRVCVRMCEINYLCVHKSLRSKRLAPVLIKEVTRRVNLCDVWHAVYTAGVRIPTPCGAARYFHRSINAQKLIEIGFAQLAPRMTMQRTKRLYALPERPAIAGLRKLEMKDVPAACTLLNTYLERFELHPRFTEAEFAHWLMPRPNVVDSFVVVADDGNVTDFISFYHLPSTVLRHPKHKDLRAVYSYYNAPGKHSMMDLMSAALILARDVDADVFNALNLMENEPTLSPLKFMPGDGTLHYYMFNWAARDMAPADIGLVLM